MSPKTTPSAPAASSSALPCPARGGPTRGSDAPAGSSADSARVPARKPTDGTVSSYPTGPRGVGARFAGDARPRPGPGTVAARAAPAAGAAAGHAPGGGGGAAGGRSRAGSRAGRPARRGGGALLAGAQQALAQVGLLLGRRVPLRRVRQVLERAQAEELQEQRGRAVEHRAELRAARLLD